MIWTFNDKVRLNPESRWTLPESIKRAKEKTVATVIESERAGFYKIKFETGTRKIMSLHYAHLVFVEPEPKPEDTLGNLIAEIDKRIQDAVKVQEKARDKEAEARLEAADAKAENQRQADLIVELGKAVAALKNLQKGSEPHPGDKKPRIGSVVKVLETPQTKAFVGQYGTVRKIDGSFYTTGGMYNSENGTYAEDLAFLATELEVVNE